MIISTSLFKGFKTEISNKVFDFWGHIHISDSNTKRTFEAIPIDFDQEMVDRLESMEPQTYQAVKSNIFGRGNKWFYGEGNQRKY